jgi:hypothetical protein
MKGGATKTAEEQRKSNENRERTENEWQLSAHSFFEVLDKGRGRLETSQKVTLGNISREVLIQKKTIQRRSESGAFLRWLIQRTSSRRTPLSRIA